VNRAGTVALLAALIAAGCGSSGGTTLESLWKQPGENVGLVPGTSDYATGSVRVSFLVIGHDGRPVNRPEARLWLARSRKDKPFASATASLESIGVPGAATDSGDVSHLYVGRLRLDKPGRYWLLAQPVGGTPIQALGTLEVKAHSRSPAVGARAYPSRTPTLATAGGRIALLTTRTPPDRALLRYSIADSLAAHVPFVVVFATPKFCASRTCGPVVDVVDSVRARFAGKSVRFIHVEIYRGNNPQNGLNRWVREWRLPSEPWTFAVGRDGRVHAKFEGSVSTGELAAAVRILLKR
jgi:hypothetical protein